MECGKLGSSAKALSCTLETGTTGPTGEAVKELGKLDSSANVLSAAREKLGSSRIALLSGECTTAGGTSEGPGQGKRDSSGYALPGGEFATRGLDSGAARDSSGNVPSGGEFMTRGLVSGANLDSSGNVLSGGEFITGGLISDA